ncbi:MAG: carbon-nitrogen hydrolase family protein [Burkholderiaceae bacterium]|nr:carbon-nitrogen hydrolase family protein [Burkholderiaceae bacterium]
MKVAMIQMVSGTQVEANLARAGALLEQAAAAGARLAVLPEYFCVMGMRDTDKLALAEAWGGGGPIQSWLAGRARALGLCIVGGTLPIATGSPDRVCNTTPVYSATGECIARYDKMHLFRYDNGRESYDEARVLQAGDAPTAFDVMGDDGQPWRVGLSVCYDLRFPELYRHLSRQGCELLLVPSAFTVPTGRAHWDVLLRARAIENLAWVGAAAQGGHHENGRDTWGHSLVIDPWGEVVACEPQGEAVVLAELSRERLSHCRGQLPALAHRRL